MIIIYAGCYYVGRASDLITEIISYISWMICRNTCVFIEKIEKIVILYLNHESLSLINEEFESLKTSI